MCVTGRTRKSVQYCNIAAAAAAAAAAKKNNRQLTCGKSWDVINEHFRVHCVTVCKLKRRVIVRLSPYKVTVKVCNRMASAY